MKTYRRTDKHAHKDEDRHTCTLRRQGARQAGRQVGIEIGRPAGSHRCKQVGRWTR